MMHPFRKAKMDSMKVFCIKNIKKNLAQKQMLTTPRLGKLVDVSNVP